MRTKKLSVLGAILMVVAGCGDGNSDATDPESAGAEKPVVYTTNYPLRYFAERIVADVAEVRLPVPGDEDPAYWNPAPEEVLAMQQADLIVLNGASYETWLSNVSLPPSRLVDTTDGLRDRLIPLEEPTTHSHGLQGEHEHSGTAFTTWLDPTLASAQAAAIKNSAAAHWPRHAGRFEANLEELARELTALDGEMQEVVAGNRELAVLFSHPVYQYLARRYRLNARSVHWEPDRVPDEQQWQELLAMLEEFPAAWMIWEDEPLPQIRERLESIGIRSELFLPCANTPRTGDFLSTMGENLDALRLVFASDG